MQSQRQRYQENTELLVMLAYLQGDDSETQRPLNLATRQEH